MVTEHTICALPEGHVDYRHFAIKVQHRSDDFWVLYWGGLYWTASGDWTANRPDAFLFGPGVAGALSLAEQLAPQLNVNGYSVADVLERGRR
jgi:hypothetical protein